MVYCGWLSISCTQLLNDIKKKKKKKKTEKKGSHNSFTIKRTKMETS